MSEPILSCRCGAFKVLTATGIRYEDNAGAICRHTLGACLWFAQFPTPVGEGTRALAPESERGEGASSITYPASFDQRTTCLWLADGRRVTVRRDGTRAWLAVEATPTVRPAAPPRPPEPQPVTLTRISGECVGCGSRSHLYGFSDGIGVGCQKCGRIQPPMTPAAEPQPSEGATAPQEKP